MSASGLDEGVIKFAADHRTEPLRGAATQEVLPQLLAWRTILHATGMVGQDPARYGGAGFGNVSCRLPPFPGARGARRFLITCTQTGGQTQLAAEHFCVVEATDVRRNSVRSFGPCQPSSESLTHGAVYDLSSAIRWVFHAHAPAIWHAAAALRLPQTLPAVAYGTVEMAQEVGRLYRETTLPTCQCFAMAGHEDGVVSYGRTAQEAGHVLVCMLARALALGSGGAAHR